MEVGPPKDIGAGPPKPKRRKGKISERPVKVAAAALVPVVAGNTGALGETAFSVLPRGYIDPLEKSEEVASGKTRRRGRLARRIRSRAKKGADLSHQLQKAKMLTKLE